MIAELFAFFPQISLLKMDTYKVGQPRRMNCTHYSLTKSALNLKAKKCGKIKNIFWSNLDKAFLNITLKKCDPQLKASETGILQILKIWSSQ